VASRPSLDVWLYGTDIGSLSEPQYAKTRFDYTEEAEHRFRPGSVTLSTSMPVNADRRPRGDVVRAFFDGLLPEGEARGVISDEFSVRRGDHFGLLSAIGRDCAGAVVLLPAGSPPPDRSGGIDPLADQDLERLVARLKERPLGADNEVRVSLPGAQEKLLLAQTPDGRWARPVGGAPSTHILKPQDMRLDSYAVAESFCLRLARDLGLTNVDTEVIDVNGRPVIVVSRYDRQRTSEGVIRIHQEDACQALGVDCSDRPYRKYQSDGGPSLREFAEILTSYTPPQDRSKLLALTATNVAVGNADAHAKNLSLMHLTDGSSTLAPAYDITPTTFYKDVPTSEGPKDLSDRLGMWINNKKSIHDVTADDLIAEGASWGMSSAQASRVVEETLRGIEENAETAATATGLPAEILDFVAQRTGSLAAGDPAGTPSKTGKRSKAAAHRPGQLPGPRDVH
jgi:serine/threonine-protein kinase HipA